MSQCQDPVLQSTTLWYKVLHITTQFYEVLQSITQQALQACASIQIAASPMSGTEVDMCVGKSEGNPQKRAKLNLGIPPKNCIKIAPQLVIPKSNPRKRPYLLGGLYCIGPEQDSRVGSTEDGEVTPRKKIAPRPGF